MNLDKKIKSETLYAISYKFVGIAISFLSVPILINFLGKEGYGLWVTLFSMISWFLIFDFGLGLGLRNKLTKAIAVKDYKISKQLIASSYISISLIFLIICGFLLILVQLLNWNEIFNTELLTNSQFKQILFVLVIGFCLLFILQIINNLNYAVHDSSNVELIKTLRQLIVFIPILLLVKSDNLFTNLFAVVSINSYLPLFVLIIFTVLFFKKNKTVKPIWEDYDFKIAKSVLKLGINFFVLRLSSIVLITSLPFLITRYVGVEGTADYNIGFKFFGMVQMSLSIILTPYWSAVSEKYRTRDFEWIKKALFKNMAWSSLGVLIIFALSLVSPYILPLWIGKTVNINFNTIYWSALLVAIFTFTEPFLLFLNGTSKIKIQTYYAIFIIISIIPISLVLFYYTNLGLAAFIIPPVVFRFIRSAHAMLQLKKLLIE
jgi:O-antigen/teichoic acid export membrane protein